ncbi:MAG: hypothetical protein J6I50_09410 [Clostridia bacterium]|nr:hypothetical protein [Clostridia bacterium]
MQNQNEEQLSKPSSALENFWYHYKWHTLIIGFFVVFFIIAIAQMTGKPSYDAHILYTGPAYLDGETISDILSVMEEASHAAAPVNDNPADYTKDQKLNLDFNKIIYVSEALAKQYQEDGVYFNALTNQSSRGQFDNFIMVGEYVILLIDQSLYQETVDTGAFCSLEDVLGYVPENAYDTCGFFIGDLPIGNANGFRQLPRDTIICCRAKSYVNNFNKKVQNEDQYAAQLALFRQLVAYQPE